MNALRLINITEQYPSADGVYHLAYYHPPKAGEQDQISKYLLDFEDGEEPQTTQWIRLAALLVSQSLSFDIIVRPVSGNEFNAKKLSSLEKLCIAISRKSGSKYQRNRLVRTKSSIGADFNRAAELANACPDHYAFSDEYTAAVSRVLVVDGFVVNEATLAAIANSIRAKLPQAKVLFFALGRIEENAQNSHLDVHYFTSTTSPMPSELAGAGEGRPWVAARGARRAVKSILANASPVFRTPDGGQTAHPPEGGSRRGGGAGRREGVGGAILIAALGLLLISGGYVLLANKRPPGDNFYQVPALTVARTEVTTIAEPVAPAEKTAAVAHAPDREPTLPIGIITVPSVGLRVEHYIDSKTLKVNVKNGEKIYIVKKVSSSTGPRWMQIRTKSGKVGWVWASVVREVRPRTLAAR